MPHGRIKKLRAKAYSDSGCPSSTAPTFWTAAFWAHPKSLVTAGCSSPSSAWYPSGCFTESLAKVLRDTKRPPVTVEFDDIKVAALDNGAAQGSFPRISTRRADLMAASSH